MIKMPWTNTTAPNVMIEVTDACNLRCRCCYKKLGNSFKSLDQIVAEIDTAGHLRPLHTVTITGGEPTLHPEICSIISAIHKRGYHSFLLTNGVLINQDRLHEMKLAGLDSILFHVDEGQERSDLHKLVNRGENKTQITQKLDELIGMAVVAGLDASMSATLYNPADTSRKIDYFLNHPNLSFLFLARAVNPENLVADKAEIRELTERDNTHPFHVRQVENMIRQQFGLEPFAYIPTTDNAADTVWMSWFIPVNHRNSKTEFYSVAGTPVDLLLMKILYRITGRYIHKTTQNGSITFLRVLLNYLFSGELTRLKRFLHGARKKSALIRHKMIVYDEGPFYSEAGEFVRCEYCPTAIFREGQLVSCCTADYEVETPEKNLEKEICYAKAD